jgi:ankyrin repeat protein
MAGRGGPGCGPADIVYHSTNYFWSLVWLSVAQQPKTPLQQAVAAGRTDVVGLMLEHCPEGAREINLSGQTPLHLATVSGKIDIVRLLLEHWMEGQWEKDEIAKTALHLAAAVEKPM